MLSILISNSTNQVCFLEGMMRALTVEEVGEAFMQSIYKVCKTFSIKNENNPLKRFTFAPCHSGSQYLYLFFRSAVLNRGTVASLGALKSSRGAAEF